MPIDVRYRVNEIIRAREVRVIDHEGAQLGIMNTKKAIDLARQVGLDLVEVAPQSVPPVCRFMDYGKFLYTQEKRDRVARKKHKTITVKEVAFRPGTDVNDFQIKLRNLRKFLEDGHKAKIVVKYRGREMAHPERGQVLLARVQTELADVAVVEMRPLAEGRQLVMVVAPKNSKPSKES